MTKREKQQMLLRRVQRDNIAECIQSLGCDRTTISHIPATERATDLRAPNTLVDMFNRHEAKRAQHDRVLREVSPFCYTCSKKYHKQIRTYECECE